MDAGKLVQYAWKFLPLFKVVYLIIDYNQNTSQLIWNVYHVQPSSYIQYCVLWIIVLWITWYVPRDHRCRSLNCFVWIVLQIAWNVPHVTVVELFCMNRVMNRTECSTSVYLPVWRWRHLLQERTRHAVVMCEDHFISWKEKKKQQKTASVGGSGYREINELCIQNWNIFYQFPRSDVTKWGPTPYAHPMLLSLYMLWRVKKYQNSRFSILCVF